VTPSFQTVELDEDHIKGLAWNILFMVWRRRTLPESYRRGIQLLSDHTRLHPKGVGVCQVVEVDAVPPDREAREVFPDLFRVPGVQHSSVIHDGAGFKAASVRAIMTGVVAIARAASKVSIFSSVSDAAQWHVELQRPLGAKFTAKELTEVVAALRALHRERFP
jgi:hypothetical protein